MNTENTAAAIETPSALAIAHARARHTCEMCGVRNFSIGGRDADGNFHPLFQVREDPAEARTWIGKIAWCGASGPSIPLRIMRIVCDVVRVRDRDEVSEMLLCSRCVGAMRSRPEVEVSTT